MRRLLSVAAAGVFFAISLHAAPSSAAVSFFRPAPHGTAVTSAGSAAVAAAQSVRARPGDTLSAIAGRVLGSTGLWPVLWWDNRDRLASPDALRRGQVVRFGSWHRVRPWLRRRAEAALPRPASPAAAPVAAVASAPAASPVSYSGGSFEACVIARESGGNPQAYNPASGAGGLFQFLPSTWASLGYAASYPGGAQTAPASVQYAAFNKLYAEAGTAPWSSYDGC